MTANAVTNSSAASPAQPTAKSKNVHDEKLTAAAKTLLEKLFMCSVGSYPKYSDPTVRVFEVNPHYVPSNLHKLSEPVVADILRSAKVPISVQDRKDLVPLAVRALMDLLQCEITSFPTPSDPDKAQTFVCYFDQPAACSTVDVHTPSQSKEQVNHPQHYGGEDNVYECIKVAEAILTPEEFVGAMRFQILKYNYRGPHKGSMRKDVQKGRFYQDYLDKFLAKHPELEQ